MGNELIQFPKEKFSFNNVSSVSTSFYNLYRDFRNSLLHVLKHALPKILEITNLEFLVWTLLSKSKFKAQKNQCEVIDDSSIKLNPEEGNGK